ncbi:MAG TPA: MarR family transcriptional regulator [Vicinamibacterales bacterium]
MLRLIPPIHRATHRIGLYLASLGDRSLSQGEAHILAMLAPTGTATMADLHKGLAHKRSTLTSIVDRLVERRFVTRHVGETDRRTFVVTLTAQGRKVAREILQRLTDLERTVKARVSSDDLRGFLTVIAAVEKEAHERGRE